MKNEKTYNKTGKNSVLVSGSSGPVINKITVNENTDKQPNVDTKPSPGKFAIYAAIIAALGAIISGSLIAWSNYSG